MNYAINHHFCLGFKALTQRHENNAWGKITQAACAMLIFFIPDLISPAQAQSILRFKAWITTEAKVLGDLLITNDPKLSALPLDSAPRAQQRIDKEQIINWIKAQKGSLSYQWKGKNSAVVHARNQSSSQALLDKAQRALRLDLEKKHYESIVLQAKSTPKAHVLPVSAFKLRLPSHYPPQRQVCVKLLHEQSMIPVCFKVKAYQKVWVARQNIKSHTASTAKDFILRQRNVSGLKSKPLRQLPESIWMSRAINKGQVLTSQHLSLMPEVIKGQPVHIQIISEGISISTQAIAQQDGHVGQRVLMMNQSANKPFHAVVTAYNEARVIS